MNWPAERAIALFKRFRAKGWHAVEPGEPYPSERPMRFERLVMEALAECMISEKRASELLGKPLEQFLAETAKDHGAGLLRCVTDTNIWIDPHRGGLIEQAFKLSLELAAPDVIISELHKPDLASKS